MASIKVFVVDVFLLLLLLRSLHGYTEHELKQLKALTDALRQMQAKGEIEMPPPIMEEMSTTTEGDGYHLVEQTSNELEETSNDLDESFEGLPLGVELPKELLDFRAKPIDENIDWFDKCMRDVMRGQFGYGKYHFTEYKFCKGWFGKKFSDEVELQTIRQPIVINGLDSNEEIKIGDPEDADSNEYLQKHFNMEDPDKVAKKQREQWKKDFDNQVAS